MNKIKLFCCCIALALGSCTNDDNPSTNADDRTIVFTLALPADDGTTVTRANLNEKDRLSYFVSWSQGEKITLFFDYNTKIYVAEGRIIPHSYSSHTASFSAELPKEINRYASYTVYGVCGKGGRVLSNVPNFYAGMIRKPIKELMAPIWFKANVIGKWPESITCSHLGAYEILHFKNKTNNAVNITFEGYQCQEPWYNQYAVYDPYGDKLYTGIQNLPTSELQLDPPTATVYTDVQFCSWYIPTGKKVKDAVLKMTIDGKKVSSVNTMSSDIDIQAGRAYHLYATWDGQKLTQGIAAFTDPLRLSVSQLTMPLDGRATADILSGNGSYTVETSNEDVASAFWGDGVIKIFSYYEGSATITVTDNFSKEKQTIQINVVNQANNLYGRIMQDMVLVEPGTFIMGVPGNDEFCSPAHQVTITKPYYIGKYEVTRKLYHEVMSSSNESEVQYPDCAVGFMAWCDVRGFLTTLNQKTGKYFRLPSNAEWEYAARGGKYSRGYVFPGSNDWEEVSNRTFIDNTNPVGTKRPNELGLYDMSGGMVEWVEDYPYEYTSEPETDPRHVDNDAYSHITRWVGIYKYNSYGVWRWLPYEGYTSCRSDFGFRIVLSPEENW